MVREKHKRKTSMCKIHLSTKVEITDTTRVIFLMMSFHPSSRRSRLHQRSTRKATQLDSPILSGHYTLTTNLPPLLLVHLNNSNRGGPLTLKSTNMWNLSTLLRLNSVSTEQERTLFRVK